MGAEVGSRPPPPRPFLRPVRDPDARPPTVEKRMIGVGRSFLAIGRRVRDNPFRTAVGLTGALVVAWVVLTGHWPTAVAFVGAVAAARLVRRLASVRVENDDPGPDVDRMMARADRALWETDEVFAAELGIYDPGDPDDEPERRATTVSALVQTGSLDASWPADRVEL